MQRSILGINLHFIVKEDLLLRCLNNRRKYFNKNSLNNLSLLDKKLRDRESTPKYGTISTAEARISQSYSK